MRRGTNESAIERTTASSLLPPIAIARLPGLPPRAVPSAFSLECSNPRARVTAPRAAGSLRSTPLPLSLAPPPPPAPPESDDEPDPGRKRPAARPSCLSRPVCLGALAPSRTWIDSHSRRRFSPTAVSREWWSFEFVSGVIPCFVFFFVIVAVLGGGRGGMGDT